MKRRKYSRKSKALSIVAIVLLIVMVSAVVCGFIFKDNITQWFEDTTGITQLKQENADLKTENETIIGEYQVVVEECETTKLNLSLKEQALSDAEKLSASLGEQIKSKDLQIAELQTNAEANASEIATLTEERNALQVELDNSNSTIETLNTDIESLNTEIETLNARIEELENSQTSLGNYDHILGNYYYTTDNSTYTFYEIYKEDGVYIMKWYNNDFNEPKVSEIQFMTPPGVDSSSRVLGMYVPINTNWGITLSYDPAQPNQLKSVSTYNFIATSTDTQILLRGTPALDNYAGTYEGNGLTSTIDGLGKGHIDNGGDGFDFLYRINDLTFEITEFVDPMGQYEFMEMVSADTNTISFNVSYFNFEIEDYETYTWAFTRV